MPALADLAVFSGNYQPGISFSPQNSSIFSHPPR
jgi:hypothetical protein